MHHIATDAATIVPVSEAALRNALEVAEGWAEHGYTPKGRAYWTGMRDTLRVVLGMTNVPPTVTGPGTDVAADTILGAHQRLNRKA